MSSTQAPPFVVDRFARTAWEKRLAQRYRKATQYEAQSLHEVRRLELERSILFARLSRMPLDRAYSWLADAVIDPPTPLGGLTIARILDDALGATQGVSRHLVGVRLADLDGWQRRQLSQGLRAYAARLRA